MDVESPVIANYALVPHKPSYGSMPCVLIVAKTLWQWLISSVLMILTVMRVNVMLGKDLDHVHWCLSLSARAHGNQCM